MKDKFYYPELDGLRFIAFLTVFIHHGPVMTWIPGYKFFIAYGWMGVDLFLCLSAFLFVHLLRMEWEKSGTINVAYFYLRRALRIWPVYMLYVACATVFLVTNNIFTVSTFLRIYGLLTFTDNLLSLYAGFNAPPWFGHLWTISYEEQFYGVIPWFLRNLFRKKRLQQALTLGLIFLAGFAIRALFIYWKLPHPSIYVLPITHFEAILFGLAIGLGMFDTLFHRIPAIFTAALGVGALYLTTLLPDVRTIDWHLMQLYPLVGFAAAMFVYSTMKSHNGLIAKILSWKPVTFLGKISYGLYLFHYVVLTFTGHWVAQNFAGKSEYKQSYLAFGVAFLITVLLGTFSYILVEKPFLKMKSKFTIVQSRPI